MLKCPNCKQDVIKAEWRDHFKICGMDSKAWKDQKIQRAQRQAQTSLAAGDEISKNLKQFANQRPDLYGGGGSSTIATAPSIPEKAQTTVPQPQVAPSMIWDGQSAHISRTTANIAMMRNQQQRNLQEVVDAGG